MELRAVGGVSSPNDITSEEEPKNNFNDWLSLVFDVTILIFNELSLSDKNSMSMACKQWYEASRNNQAAFSLLQDKNLILDKKETWRSVLNVFKETMYILVLDCSYSMNAPINYNNDEIEQKEKKKVTCLDIARNKILEIAQKLEMPLEMKKVKCMQFADCVAVSTPANYAELSKFFNRFCFGMDRRETNMPAVNREITSRCKALESDKEHNVEVSIVSDFICDLGDLSEIPHNCKIDVRYISVGDDAESSKFYQEMKSFLNPEVKPPENSPVKDEEQQSEEQAISGMKRLREELKENSENKNPTCPNIRVSVSTNTDDEPKRPLHKKQRIDNSKQSTP